MKSIENLKRLIESLKEQKAKSTNAWTHLACENQIEKIQAEIRIQEYNKSEKP